MRKPVLESLAVKQNKTVGQMLTEMFDKHGSLSEVARELKVTPSTVSISLMRAGLKCKTVIVPRTQEGQI